MSPMRACLPALLSLAMCGAATAAPRKAARPEVGLDARVELAAGLHLLAAAQGERATGFRDDGSAYARTLREGVFPWKDHPAVDAYRREIRRTELNGFGFMTALHELHRCLDDRLALRSDPDDCRRSAFAHAAADFAAKSRFLDLMARLRETARPELDPLLAARDRRDLAKSYEHYAGLPAVEQRVAPSPLLEPRLAWNDLDRSRGDGGQILTVVSPRASTATSRFDWASVLRDVGHEESHALLDSASDAADAAGGGPPPGAPVSCYGSWTQCVREHVAQGVSLRMVQIARERRLPFAPDAALNDRLPWQADAVLLLKDYEAHRGRYKTLRDFVPRIVALLRAKAAALPRARGAAPAPTKSEKAAAGREIERGMTLFAAGRTAEAVDAFEAAARDGGAAEALLNLSAARRAQGRTADGAAALDRAIAAAREDATTAPELLPDALSSRADLRASAGDQSGAASDLREALAAAPEDWPRRAETSRRLVELQGVSASYRYFYQDVFKPFFFLNAAKGRYEPSRPGAHASSFPAVKAPGTFRVFVVGGSIAGVFGEDDLKAALSRLLPGRTIEVINCGMSGYDSPREERVLDEVLGYAPDAVVLMSGHNESLAVPWVPEWSLKVAEWAAKWRLSGARPDAMPAGAARRKALTARLDEFEATLRRMARAAAGRGTPLVVFLPPLNVRDFPSATNLPSQPAFLQGWSRFLEGDCAAARKAWAAVPAPDAMGASLAAFFSGKCLEAEGNIKQADDSFERALVLDQPLLGRCGPDCRGRMIRAGGEPGAVLADGDAEFRAYAAPRPPGYDEFKDGVHWRGRLNALAVRAVVAALWRTPEGKSFFNADVASPPRPAPARREGEWLSLLRVGAHAVATVRPGDLSAVGFAALDYAARRRSGRLDVPELLERLEKGSDDLGKAWEMPALSIPRGGYEWTLAVVQLSAGRMKEASEAFDAAVRAGVRGDRFWADLAADKERAGEGRTAAEIRGMLARKEGSRVGPPSESASRTAVLADPAAARRRAAALASRAPGDAVARGQAAMIFEWLGDAAEARRVWCLEPIPDAEARLRCARAEFSAGDSTAAVREARLASAPGNGPDARREAALILQDAGRVGEALEIFHAAASSDAANAGALRDYGVALSLAGREGEAIAVLRLAAKLEPEPGDALLSLAAAYDAAGRGSEAEACLRSSLRRATGASAARLKKALAERAKKP